jgi:2-succinyl-5-enolpyruvyl-6-hydroxy-3-cyclohexene-1-carboxylate synthase
VTDRNAAFAATLVDVLDRLGVRHACVTPGSRNTPLSLALADSPIHDWSHHDERSSAFFALGIARTTTRPVVIVTTSGTAAAELHPALAEAINARVPLIAITADRPLALRHVGAPQTIDQEDLFGRSVKWAADVEPEDDASGATGLAMRLWSESMTPPRGPVHLNVRFDEPLVPDGVPASAAGPLPETPFPVVEDRDAPTEVAAQIAGRRGIVIAGPDADSEVQMAATALAAAAGWPILADPLSGLRAGRHDRSHVMTASDPLAWAGYLERSRPEIVVRFGAVPTSMPIWKWLGAHREVPQIFIEPVGLRDPTASASRVVRSEVATALVAIAAELGTPADPGWLESWLRADRAAAGALAGVVDAAPFPNEPAIVKVVVEAMPDPSVLWVASSMPVRDLDAVMRPTATDIRVMANRGANGIDGFISSALGSAAVSGTPTVALSGDLSMVHDVGALATARRIGTPLTIVVIDNDGGGIFHLLPQAGNPHFERHWGTPHGLDLSAVAAGFGIDAEHVTDPERLGSLVANPPAAPRLIELRTDRTRNAELHREIFRAVAKAVEGVAG